MNAKEQLEEQRVLKRRHLNARNKTVLVQCDNYQCMAYRDVDGKWRGYFNNEELRGEVTEIKPY